VNIYPGQIEHVLSQIPGLGSEYQVHLFRREDGRDLMHVKVEKIDGDSPDDDRRIADEIMGEIRQQILVCAQVELLPYGTLPRTERKSKRVYDHRSMED
jgi:phenylacetate-CoA ligase